MSFGHIRQCRHDLNAAIRSTAALYISCHRHIHDRGAVKTGKKTGAVIILTSSAVQSFYRASRAVKGAAVWAADAADRSPGNGLSAYIFSADLAEVDIVGELGPGAGLALVVDFVSKFPQIIGGSNLVRIIRCAGAAGERSLTTR